MRVGVIDVGSNTIRLLVAADGEAGVVAVREERARVGLAADVERSGCISVEKLSLAAKLAKDYARLAREAGAVRVEVLVTAPGRQSENGETLVGTLADATGAPVRSLTAEEEARLAFAGAVSTLPGAPASVTVCDVGGGSTQLVFGTPPGGPVWFRSLDIGSLRLAQRFLRHDPPRAGELRALRGEVESQFAGFAPPLPRVAVAAGGTARALRRLGGRTLAEKQLAKAIERLARCSTLELSKSLDVEPWRAETLLAGATILAAAQLRLGVPLVVARGGLREGAVRDLLVAEAA